MAFTVTGLNRTPSSTLVSLNTSPSSTLVNLNTSPSSTLVNLNTSPSYGQSYSQSSTKRQDKSDGKINYNPYKQGHLGP